MSTVTNFLMYTAIEDSGVPAFFTALTDMPGGVLPSRIPYEGFAGRKRFEGDAYAAAGSNWDTSSMQAVLDGVWWEEPDQVVVICCTGEKPAEVYRPTNPQ